MAGPACLTPSTGRRAWSRRVPRSDWRRGAPCFQTVPVSTGNDDNTALGVRRWAFGHFHSVGRPAGHGRPRRNEDGDILLTVSYHGGGAANVQRDRDAGPGGRS